MSRTTFYMLEQEQKAKKEKEKAEKEIDYTEAVKQYHKGGGYYDLPNIEEVIQGKEKAIAALKESDN